MTGLDITELRRLERAMTLGPWGTDPYLPHLVLDSYRNSHTVADCRYSSAEKANAAGIVALRNSAIPLLDRLEKAEARVAELEAGCLGVVRLTLEQAQELANSAHGDDCDCNACRSEWGRNIEGNVVKLAQHKGDCWLNAAIRAAQAQEGPQ